MNEHSSQILPASSDNESDSGEQAGESPEPGRQSTHQRPTLLERMSAFWRQRNGNSLREDLTDALSEAADAAEFSPGERAMLNNILRLREVRVEDVMVVRAEVQAVDISTKLGDLLRIFEDCGHSRLPVYDETLDDPRGMVHIRDVMGHLLRVSRNGKRGRGQKKVPGSDDLDLSRVDLTRTIGVLNLMRPLLFVPPSMLASDLMTRMQADRIQMALVIDEYGGTDGLASLEDIVEMVVGDIEDEHDEEEPLVTQTGDGIFVVDARAEIDQVARKVGDSFKATEHEEDVDTIGGIIFNTLGRVPVRGEVIQAIPGFEFHVLDADPRRVKRVRIVQLRAGERKRRVQKASAGSQA